MSRASLDIAGRRFERLTCIRPLERRGRQTVWFCRCDCGNEFTALRSNIRRGITRSCGCLKRDLLAQRATHGNARPGGYSPEYYVWGALVQRCTNPRNKQFKDYGGRGITVCAEWRASFAAFLADMGSRPYPRATIERIDNDGPYCKANCKWGTRTEQSRNRRGRRLVSFGGEMLPLSVATERAGVPYNVARNRLNRGWPIERALAPEVS
jgi:hypothetical protein